MLNKIVAHKKYLMFAIIVVLIGVVAGLVYYNFLSKDIQNNIIYTITNSNKFTYNAIIKDLVIMSLLLILSFFIIGVPLSIFYLFYESLSIGFLINIFYVSFKIKGILYILLYILINKLIPLVIIIFFIYKIINIGRLMIGLIIYKNEITIKEKIIIYFKNALYLIIGVFIINIILYFLSSYIFKYLSFLIG